MILLHQHQRRCEDFQLRSSVVGIAGVVAAVVVGSLETVRDCDRHYC